MEHRLQGGCGGEDYRDDSRKLKKGIAARSSVDLPPLAPRFLSASKQSPGLEDRVVQKRMTSLCSA